MLQELLTIHILNNSPCIIGTNGVQVGGLMREVGISGGYMGQECVLYTF